MAIVKPFNLYMFYDIFMALCYILILLSICTFEVCCKIPCGETSCFSGIIQLICDASKVSALCKVWVFTFESIRANYRFCCFGINKLSCYLIFAKSTFFVYVFQIFPYMGTLLYKTSSRDIPLYNIIAFLHVFSNLLSSML